MRYWGGLAQAIETLRTRRYPVMLVIQQDDPPLDTGAARTVADRCLLRYVDYRQDVLIRNDSGIVLGAYLRSQFREWLKDQAREAGGILVVNPDELISSWPAPERRAFFLDFLHIECNQADDPTRRAPIVLFSRHAGRFNLPTSELGQGIVFDPSMAE